MAHRAERRDNLDIHLLLRKLRVWTMSPCELSWWNSDWHTEYSFRIVFSIRKVI